MSNTVILPLEFAAGDFKMHINPVAIRGAHGIMLVDCGFPGFLPKLEAAMAEKGMEMKDVKKILITHHDGDHMGTLKALLDKYPGIEVLCSPEQAPYVTGKEKPLRLKIFEKRYESLTDEGEKQALQMEMSSLRKLETVENVTVISDGYMLPDFGAWIIEVSGHMPGHLCLYMEQEKTLVSGDALTSGDGKLLPPDSRFTLDMPSALKSLEKLLNYDIKTVVCYHGGLVKDQVKQSLLSIVRSV